MVALKTNSYLIKLKYTTMITIYPLEWLDNLIVHTLNPKRTNIKDLSDDDLALISEQLVKESHRVQMKLIQEIFSFRSKAQMRLLIRNYHSTLIFLLDSLLENQKETTLHTARLSRMIDTIINTLDELLFFIEGRFSAYLSLDQRVPMTYLLVARKELILKLEKLEKMKLPAGTQRETLQLVIDVLFNFLHSCIECKVTYRQILYQKELIQNLETMENTGWQNDLYTGLEQLLIELNFNSPVYISYLLEQISVALSSQDSLKSRMELLLVYHKEFGKLISNEKMSFDPLKDNIKHVLENWFRLEFDYMDKKLSLPDSGNHDLKTQPDRVCVPEENKVECNLSIDQMGLILRAGDEARILKATLFLRQSRNIFALFLSAFS